MPTISIIGSVLPVMRIVHIHLPKTAGSALFDAFKGMKTPKVRVCPVRFERQFKKQDDLKDYDFYSGHMSFHTAERIGGDFITVLRDPVDRFLSIYYFWRSLYQREIERTRATTLAINYSLDDFASFFDDKGLIEALYNRMTWQLAYSWEVDMRNDWRQQHKLNDLGVLELAKENLSKFKVVGFQERYSDVVEKLNGLYGINMANKEVNVTKSRERAHDISPETLAKIRSWLHLDVQLYEYALTTFGQ